MIAFNKASLVYQNKPVFKGLTCAFAPKKWHVVLGESGVGKSSLLRMIAGLPMGDTCVLGEVVVKGEVSLMAQGQSSGLLPWRTVLQNVMLGDTLRGRASSASCAKAQQLLAQVGLSDVADQSIAGLSGGMAQRVALARVLFEDTPIVLMDEPFSALDISTKYKMHELAHGLLKNKTVVMVTHDPLEAARLADEVVVLQGTPAEIVKTLRCPVSQGVRPVSSDVLHQVHEQLLEHLLATP